MKSRTLKGMIAKKKMENVLMNFYRPEEFSHIQTHLRLSYCVTWEEKKLFFKNKYLNVKKKQLWKINI